ncbi:hypothetical protein RKD54_001923 [Pseudarthrobacter sp. SLBN-100]
MHESSLAAAVLLPIFGAGERDFSLRTHVEV